jgi:glycine/D-amino acid oxidase-like deaminating enzyme
VNRPDVAVIGAGILGSLVAREIVTRDPGARVVVLDRDAVGTGASRRSAGLHFPRGTTGRVRQMSAYSEDYYARMLRDDPGVPIYRLDMSVVARRGLAASLHASYLDRAKLAAVEATGHPEVGLADGLGAWAGEGCQYADVYALAQHIARELRPRVQYREGVAVTGLFPGPEGVRLTLGTGEELVAARAVLAPGPWAAAAAWRELTSPLGIRIKKVVALHIERPPRPGEPCVVFEEEDAFLLPVVHRGHMLFSYTCQEWDVDPDALRDGLAADHLAEAREVLRRYAPALADQCTSGRVFCDAYSLDGQPVVRALDEQARVVFAGAANGSGYRLGPAMAADAVNLLGLPQLGKGALSDHQQL